MKAKWIIGALLLLSVITVLVLGSSSFETGTFGTQRVGSYDVADEATGTITATGGRLFSWTIPRRHVIVQLSPDATANLYCRINEETANASSSEWDFCLEPGGSWSGYSQVQVLIEDICCKADAAIGTEGTTYIVKGMK